MLMYREFAENEVADTYPSLDISSHTNIPGNQDVHKTYRIVQIKCTGLNKRTPDFSLLAAVTQQLLNLSQPNFPGFWLFQSSGGEFH